MSSNLNCSSAIFAIIELEGSGSSYLASERYVITHLVEVCNLCNLVPEVGHNLTVLLVPAIINWAGKNVSYKVSLQKISSRFCPK